MKTITRSLLRTLNVMSTTLWAANLALAWVNNDPEMLALSLALVSASGCAWLLLRDIGLS